MLPSRIGGENLKATRANYIEIHEGNLSNNLRKILIVRMRDKGNKKKDDGVLGNGHVYLFT
jgi:hypothetical protein